MKENYHHGNLCAALIDEATYILESEGLSGLSLRKVARQVGVSQAAPYAHFKDKSALLIAVCEVGYAKFTERMRVEAGEQTGPAYIAGLGRGYIYFALENPALFELMFSAEFPGETTHTGAAFQEGYQLLDDGLSRFPISYFQDDNLSRVISWGLVHGLAHLLLSGRIVPEQHGFKSIEDFVQSSMDKFVGQ
jgi:AcrR family transcriptional regulator